MAVWSASSEYVSAAAHIAKASKFKQIKMVRSREDDLKAGYYRPSTTLDISLSEAIKLENKIKNGEMYVLSYRNPEA